MGYLKDTKGNVIGSSIDKEERAHVKLELFTDSDFAGDVDTRRSTSGWIIFVRGEKTNCLLSWGSKKQSAVALSSAEAEVVALRNGMRQTIPIRQVMERLLGRQIAVKIKVDAKAALDAVNNGYSKRLNHMRRVHGVSLGWIADEVHNGGYELQLVASKDNIADALTKNLPAWSLVDFCALVGMRDTKGAC